MGLSIEQVAQGTGLTVDEVKSLAKMICEKIFSIFTYFLFNSFQPLTQFCYAFRFLQNFSSFFFIHCLKPLNDVT